jgi:predicted SnoaL-like aldol condensation-catalyzing enzyme
MTEANKIIARRFFEQLYANGELELVDEIVAPNYVAHGPGSEPNALESNSAHANGREAVIASLKAKPADIAVVVAQQIAEGDTVVSRLGFSSNGKQWTAVAIQRIQDGKLVETWRIANRA